MKPRLIFPANSPDFETIPLENIESFSLGRSEANQLKVADIDVSRRHCLIEPGENGEFRLKDLRSRNGTFVNEARVTETVLRHGDYIRVGRTRLLFLQGDETVAMPLDQNFQFDDGRLITRSETVFESADQRRLLDASPDLSALSKFGEALAEIENDPDWRERFLKIILEIIPAERGAILLYEDPASIEPSSVAVAVAGAGDAAAAGRNEKMTISRTVCLRVLRERAALVSNDVSGPAFEKAESLIAMRVSSLLCVPLTTGERAAAAGLLYLDSSDPETRFTENHLRQAVAVSFLVAAAVESRNSLERLRQENARLQSALDVETDLVGAGDEIGKVLQTIGKVARADSNVLITGESGTGKELAAQSIHRNSPRRGQPFVAINCAALNENLLESELFGHEKGAFTGAFAQKKGRLEAADGGTLFLDEIGELAPRLQAKLLRVLQEREFERVGGTRPVKTDVRVVAATNRDLAEEVKRGNFREDLFFRLNVVRLAMPPLRRRKADIPLLAEHFLRKHSRRCNRSVAGFSKEALFVLTNCDWLGNVRQLENAVEHAVVLGSTDLILPEDLPEEICAEGMSKEGVGEAAAGGGSYQRQLLEAKRRIVAAAIEGAGGNLSEAARSLGIHPNNLHRLLHSLGIKPENKKS